MYVVQRRKSENSQWHTVKFPRGKDQGKAQAKTIELVKPILERCQKEFPGKEHRVLDTKTNNVVEVG